MKRFESILIINGNLNESEVEKVQEKIINEIKQNGGIENVENWGKKKLAYPVKGHSQGIYVLINFLSNMEYIDELEKIIGNTEEVIKHIIVKVD